LDGKSARHTTLTEMTAHYVREISSFQPAGSIQLAGYSMGGIIAYEVARQLRVTGRRVGVLALLDTTPAGPVPLVFRGYNQLLHRYWFHFRRWCHMPVPEKRAFLGRRWATVRAFFNRMPGRPQAVAASANASEIAAPPAPTDYYHDIVRRHSLRPYAGSADVFASDDFEEGWRFYWRYLVRRRLRFHRVPGKHLEIFSEKNLPFLVTSLKAVLEDARLKDTGRRPAEEDNAHNIS
jgi:thioesterase domain-containing protein